MEAVFLFGFRHDAEPLRRPAGSRSVRLVTDQPLCLSQAPRYDFGLVAWQTLVPLRDQTNQTFTNQKMFQIILALDYVSFPKYVKITNTIAKTMVLNV